MPRPARMGRVSRPEQPSATTPTRPAATNSITAAIPPSMLETPTGPRFQSSPQAVPRPHELESSVPDAARGQGLRRQREADLFNRPGRAAQATPVTLDDDDTISESPEPTQPLADTGDDTFNEDASSLLDSVNHNLDESKTIEGLREISSLATWTLSSAKPGCALAQLRHPSPSHFWQSDGPQPHTLTLHFFKLVSVVKIRVYLDFKLDESYTPTKMKFFAGMSEGGLVEFGSWEVQESVDETTGEVTSNVEKIRGWIEVPLKGVGGRDPKYYEEQERRRTKAYEKRMQLQRDGDTSAMDIEEEHSEDDDLVGGDVLRAFILQVKICENHQNGKDTHVRGFQVFANDEASGKEVRKLVKRTKLKSRKGKTILEDDEDIVGLQPASWMAEQEIR